jgi:iron complex outermembrane recepter protein
MKRIVFFLCFFISFYSFSQNGGEIKGTVKDAVTGETIVGASVLYAEGKGAVTDLDGNFSIKIDSAGQYTLTISYVGFQPQKVKVKVGGGKAMTLNFSLETQTLNEVEVVADVAKTRETPVAFSNISSKQIQEELGTRDLPMVLNSTPGVYATEQGGGSGDARVSVRGFDQRNVAVMVDGVPVNDMENGQVYWSNWDGLGDITRTMQVQRGLGASKLAVASVGGTINIITKGIDQKMGANVKQEVNDYGLYKTSFGFNTGQLKGGWGLTLAGSRKWGTGYVDATFDDAYSYFLKVQKRFKKHLFSLSASGAPQKHGQRSFQMSFPLYDKTLADNMGINADSVYKYMGTHSSQYYTTATRGERGIKYNPNWGKYIDKNGEEILFNDKVNYFHKPQFNFSHFWNPNDKLNVSTVLYLSIGKGGGTGMKTTAARDTTEGLIKVQSIYDFNSTAYSPLYSTTEHSSGNYLRSANNDHIWYGILSTWNYKISKHFNAMLGVDGRFYKGTHYQIVYDLLGGDYAIDASDKNQPTGMGNTQYSMKRKGDKVSYYNDAKVTWGGMFGQVEFKQNKWTAFVTGSFSETGYQRIDYFRKRDLVLEDGTYEQAVGYNDVFYYNGHDHITALNGAVVTTSGDTTYVDNPGSGPVLSIVNATGYTNQSSESRAATTKKLWFPGYTMKGGTNYNIDDHNNVFINLGYLNMAPRMSAVFDNSNKKFLEVKNQKVYAIEGGYGVKHQKFAANVNLYYTLWKNKPPTNTPSVVTPEGTFSYNINGLDALHKGVEIDFIYKILKNLDFEGLAAIGDWKTISGTKVYIENDQGTTVATVDFSAKDVHVGDAAQIQYSGSLRYEVIHNLYIKPRFTFFAKNYANFDPTLLTDYTNSTGPHSNKDRESWRLPNYSLLDVFVGYDFKVWKMKFGLSFGATNILSTSWVTTYHNGRPQTNTINGVYITDALNGSNFDASTATGFVGMGTRYNIALKIGF